MIAYIIFTLFVVFYTTMIRFVELKENTSMYLWKEYWFKKDGIVYILNILIVGLLIYLISKI